MWSARHSPELPDPTPRADEGVTAPDPARHDPWPAAWDDRLLRLLAPQWSLPPVWRYGLAVIIVVAATALRRALVPIVGIIMPYNITFLAVVLTTVLLGIGPGLLVVLLGDLAVEVFVTRSLPAAFSGLPLARLGSSTALGVFVSWLVHAINTAHLRAQRSEATLRASEARYRAIVETAAEGMVLAGPDGAFVFANQRMAEMLGCPVHELVGRTSLDFTFDEEREHVLQARQALGVGQVVHGEATLRRCDGSVGYSLYSASPLLNDQGQHVGNLIMHTDITERKQAEEALLAAERARTELAQHLNDEISHRVKNNLAMISGLLQMQAIRQGNPVLSDALKDSVGRVRTFVTLHEQMYRGRSEQVALLEAVRQVAEMNLSIFGGTREVDLSITGAELFCHSRDATNFAVMANELVTNALKHGGPVNGVHHVAVRLETEGESVVLEVWNSGHPVPEGFDPTAGSGMGLLLVTDLVGNYAGRFLLAARDDGTLARVELPAEEFSLSCASPAS